MRAIELDGVEVGYGSYSCTFNNQIEIVGTNGPFSEGGDSGALVLNDDNEPIGLLFAGAGGQRPVTFANPIEAVTSTLRLRLV